LIVADLIDETRSETETKSLPEYPAAKNKPVSQKAAQEADVIVNTKTESKVNGKGNDTNVSAPILETKSQSPSEQTGVKDQGQSPSSVKSDPKIQNTPTQDVKPKKAETATKPVVPPATETKSVDTPRLTDSKVQPLMDAPVVREDKVSESVSKDEAVKSENQETLKTRTVFSRLAAVFGIGKATTVEPIPSTTPPATKQTPEISEQPQISEQGTSKSTSSKLTKAPNQSQLSESNLSWTPPSTLSVKTPEIPLQSTIFSSTLLTPPRIYPLPASEIPTGARLPLCPPSTTSTPDIIAFYTKEVLANRPTGISETDMERLLTAWLNIERWYRKIEESQIRRAARVALSKAEEILALRKELRDLKGEELFVEEGESGESERSVFERVLGSEKEVYPLTEEVKDTGIEGVKECIPTPSSSLEAIDTAPAQNTTSSPTSATTSSPSPPPTLEKSEQTTAAAEIDQSPETTVNINIAVPKPAQPSSQKYKPPGKDTTLQNSMSSHVSPHTSVKPAPLGQSQYSTTGDTLAALSAQNQAEVRDRLGG
jgi:hypothetical protein